MQKFPRRTVCRALVLLGLGAFTACDAPDEAYVTSAPQLSEFSTPSLLSCPSAQTRATRGRVLPVSGGVVRLDGNAVSIPAAALLGAAEIEIEVPASAHMLVELRTNDQEHWQFLAPLTVTIDYSRCPIGLLDGPVTVYHVDPATGALLEPMGGVDDRLTRTITFVTDHFSGYAIAN
jgi:hypothetical protein